MSLARIAREVTEPQVMSQVTEDWSEKLWYPPKGQIGSPWLPSPNSTDDKLNMENVEILFLSISAYTICTIALVILLTIAKACFDKSPKKKYADNLSIYRTKDF